jgi:hypothetical protein
MVDLGEWFKDVFWPEAETFPRTATKLITKQLESYLPSALDGVPVEGGLLPARRARASGAAAFFDPDNHSSITFGVEGCEAIR